MNASANPFKVRDNELDVEAARVPLREVLSISTPSELDPCHNGTASAPLSRTASAW